MSPDERKAHNILHGQSLHDEWCARAALVLAGRVRWREGIALGEKRAIHQMEYSENFHNARDMNDEACELIAKGNNIWRTAVQVAGLTMQWRGEVCTLSNGETYTEGEDLCLW